MRSHIYNCLAAMIAFFLSSLNSPSFAADSSFAATKSQQSLSLGKAHYYKNIICGVDIGDKEKDLATITRIAKVFDEYENVMLFPSETRIDFSSGGSPQSLLKKGFDIFAGEASKSSHISRLDEDCLETDLTLKNMSCLSPLQIQSLLSDLCAPSNPEIK